MDTRRYLDCARLNLRVLSLLWSGRWVRRGDVASSYDQLAPQYDEAWLAHLKSTTDRLLESLPSSLPTGTFLDLGCGTGYVSGFLALRHSEREIVACDLSVGMIREARTKAETTAIRWQVADMVDFLRSQPSGSAALVVAAWSVGYADYATVFRECRRVLCHGGTLAFVVNLADTLAPLRRAFRYCMQAHASELRCLARFPFPRDRQALCSALRRARLRTVWMEEGHCAIQVPGAPEDARRRLPWLLRTGTLAGFDAMLPLDREGPVAATFEARLAADPEPIRHHYVLATASR